MAKYTFEKDTMPHYRQMTSACGLTAALMAIQPNVDRGAKDLLDKLAQKCLVMFPGLEDMLDTENSRHQVAAAYLILLAARSSDIEEQLTRFDPANYEYIQSVIIYELEKRMQGKVGKIGKPLEKLLEGYAKKGTIDKTFLREYTTRIKTDIELKLLMALFGHAFVRFPYSPDGTGSVSFEQIDNIVSSNLVKDETLNTYDEIYEFMLTFVEAKFDTCTMLINTGFHWVTAQKLVLDEDKRVPDLYYLDPSSSSKPLKLVDWTRGKSFYLFAPDPALRAGMPALAAKIAGVKIGG